MIASSVSSRIRDRAALADDLEQHALQAQERRQRHDERRDAQPGDQQADDQRRSPRRWPGTTRIADPPRPARAGSWQRPSPRAAVPAVKPAERSISPSSRTNTSPIAMTMTGALWLIRLAKLNELVNVSGRSDGEHDQQHEQAEDGGQRPDVAAAHPRDVLARRIGERSSAGAGGTSSTSSGQRHDCSSCSGGAVPLLSSPRSASCGSVTTTWPTLSTSGPPVISSTTSDVRHVASPRPARRGDPR